MRPLNCLALIVVVASFCGADSLKDADRLGKIADAQGIVAVKPVAHERWTLACEGLLLEPGDLVRTDVRGANAARIQLAHQTGLILGPGTLVELVGHGEVRLLSGELEVQASRKTPMKITGPDQQTLSVDGKRLLRVAKSKLVPLAKEPNWLQGFKGTIASESLGSLIAKIDGRDVPLTVGYHKVTVDIRDQIARTTIEESFVNHTAGQLEGVFYFPLPADASISGFGMWIGDQLVEADIVEKQRAREIYETILRERRDPGLLEWSGGNLFKARVFPIFAHSEKRIKITYTQVLPLMSGSYRYSYGLESELLKQHPLRELSLQVKISSELPISRVQSPTHAARIRNTEHSAEVEFSAQEYTPDRDFEVVAELAPHYDDVVLVPHQRGEDGYFLLLVHPPGDGPRWKRALLPDGQPLELLILADTSGSMDAAARKKQEAFIAAVLSSLGPKDTVNVAVCDVDCTWMGEKPVAGGQAALAQVRDFLASRHSLGWSDLRKAFEQAMAKAGPQTHVIYLGDGIVTTGDGDPVALAGELKRMHTGKGTFHAVATGSSYDQTVLRAIASLGGGSVRRIQADGGAQDSGSPQSVAAELLGEIAQNPVRDLKIEFAGLRTARVYPDPLPNLAGGAQQIILGRYLPEGRAVKARVIVSGTQGGKPVRFETAVNVADAGQGNSFIPRLWARMHLDALLEQGTSSSIQQEIVALSEEYQIMTPYTSFLVLENDEDRARFKVKRGFRMRDGEKFFVQGRDRANYELVQQQMQRAGNWRIGIRRNVLAELSQMGRESIFWIQAAPGGSYLGEEKAEIGRLGIRGRFKRDSNGFAAHDRQWFGAGDYQLGAVAIDSMTGANAPLALSAPESASPYYMADDVVYDWLPEGEDISSKEEDVERFAGPQNPFDDVTSLMSADRKGKFEEMLQVNGPGFRTQDLIRSDDAYRSNAVASGWKSLGSALPGRLRPRESGDRLMVYDEAFNVRLQRSAPYYWNSMIPAVPPPPIEPDLPDQEPWPAEIRALSESLLGYDKLAAVQGGLVLTKRTETFDVRHTVPTDIAEERDLISPKAWLMHSWSGTSQSMIQWCNPERRGILSLTFDLGRERASVPADLARPPLSEFAINSLEQTYRGHRPAIESQTPDRVLLKLTQKSYQTSEVRIAIDTRRHVLLSVEYYNDRKLTTAILYDDFVEVAGMWWPTRVERQNGKRQRTTVSKLNVRQVSTEQFQKMLADGLRPRERVIVFRDPLPSLRDAKQAVFDRKATLEHQFVMLLYCAASQQWDRADKHLAAIEQLAGGKPGAVWLRNTMLLASRRHEILKKRILDQAARLAKRPPPKRGEGDTLYAANHLLSQFASSFEASERLAVLNVLRPAFERAPEYVLGLKRWKQQRLSFLQQSDRQGEALKLLKELADSYPFDQDLQAQYAQMLANQGEFEAAYDRLTKALESRFEWESYEADTLRRTYADLLENQGRTSDSVPFIAKWIALEPWDSDPYARYLAALLRTNQIEKFNAVMTQWLQAASHPEAMSPPIHNRLSAAVQQALGRGRNMYHHQIDERWLKPLAEVVRGLIRSEVYRSLPRDIMGHPRFQASDEAKALRTELFRTLEAEARTLPPPQLAEIVNWMFYDATMSEMPAWKKVLSTLAERWSAEKDPDQKQQLAQTILRILGTRFTADEVLAFLERQLSEGPQQFRASCVQQLFGKLMELPWTQPHEDRAFKLLDELGANQKKLERLAAQVVALQQLVDRMIAARVAKQVEALEHPEKLSRRELRAKYDEIGKAAQTALADRLAKKRAAHAQELMPWLTIEALYLDARLGRNLDKVAGEAWEYLGAKPKTIRDVETDWPSLVLRIRYLATLANLAARQKADSKLAGRLLAYIDQGIEADPDAPVWKVFKYQLLVALDRPQELELALRKWIKPADADNTWRVNLGYLLAEQGKIAEAIKLFETVEAADELAPPEYRVLSDWYMVENRKDRHRQARIAGYMAEGEQILQQRLYVYAQVWQRGSDHMPSQLDPEVLDVLKALFQKSQRPESHVWQLRQLYEYSRDFRLLECLADAVVGHSAMEIYPFLGHLQQPLTEIRDEATVDAMIEHVNQMRNGKQGTVDQRALDLLTFLVERRACELKNQSAPHASAAVAALRRATKGKWEPTERRLLADLLAVLGKISTPDVSREQLDLLRRLHAEEQPGSYDRLHIADRWASVLSQNSRVTEAIEILESALDEFRQASNGILPATAQSALGDLVSYQQTLGHFARGERVLLVEMKRAVNDYQKRWMQHRLYELYVSALSSDGTVSLGRGTQLYTAAAAQIVDELQTSDPNHGYQLVNTLCSLYQTAHDKKIASVASDLSKFAHEDLPKFLIRQSNNHQDLVSRVSETLHAIAGPKPALAFLIERIEKEPAYLRYTNQDGWSQSATRLGEWRGAVPVLGELEPRLLKIVKDALRRDLESGQSRNQVIYYRHSSYFWKEKADDFATVAEAVLEKKRTSSTTLLYVARYLREGLDRLGRAIDVLAEAHRRKALDAYGQSQLAQFLHEALRFADSIPILTPLVERFPDQLYYRVLLMHAYFRTGQSAQLTMLLDETDRYFHEKKLWNENTLAQLAASTLRNELFERSVAYYKELIPQHQRSQPNQGIGNGTLSSYYIQLAEAYSGLKRTPEAVEAASAAIVSWGPRLDRRRDAIARLKSVLANAPDLDAFVKLLEKQVEESGLENPIVRKALGQVYLERREFAKAVVQLRLAVESQSNDAETQQVLIGALDELGKPQEAIEQVHLALDLSRRNLDLLKDLARRYTAVGRPDQAERAYTNIVEMLPSEAESHQALAEIRQQQDRWQDAIIQWQQVARLRALEPTGYLGLTSALIHTKNLDGAAQTLGQLTSKDWPSRFGNVSYRARELERQLESARGSRE